jgi:hypothetical protein
MLVGGDGGSDFERRKPDSAQNHNDSILERIEGKIDELLNPRMVRLGAAHEDAVVPEKTQADLDAARKKKDPIKAKKIADVRAKVKARPVPSSPVINSNLSFNPQPKKEGK